ncbi:MAG: hypothetical protein GY711_14105 [bacterium]|nr:hypothetical protein [bacterium]
MTHRCRRPRAIVSIWLLLFLPAAHVGAQTIVADDREALDRLGFGVSLSSTTLFAGAPGDDDGGSEAGAAYVYERGTSGWDFVQKLVPPDLQPNDQFGRVVEVRGNVALVSAPGAFEGAVRPAAVYVFQRSGGVWNQVARFETPTGETDDRFGWNAAVSSDWILVGASRDDDAGADAGAMYVYKRSGGAWALRQKIVLPTLDPGDFFGWSLALDGRFAAVSAYGDDDAGVNAGSVYVLRRRGDRWRLRQKLVGSTVGDFDNFGSAVAMHGRYLVASAPSDASAGPESGVAYTFRRSGSTYGEESRIAASDGAAGDGFGVSVSISGDKCLIGSSHSDASGEASGSAYVFSRLVTGWSEIGKLVAFDARPFDYFGLSVAIDRDEAACGAFGADDRENGTGAVYEFDRSSFAGPWWELYCFCDQGLPCANPDLSAGCVNSSGDGARLRVFGSPSVAKDNLVLTVGSAPPSSIGQLAMGDATAPVVFHAGTFCVGDQGSGLWRFPVMTADASGAVVLGPGIVAASSTRFPQSGHIFAGATWSFQYWFVDGAGVCASDELNMSNALTVTFRP